MVCMVQKVVFLGALGLLELALRDEKGNCAVGGGVFLPFAELDGGLLALLVLGRAFHGGYVREDFFAILDQ